MLSLMAGLDKALAIAKVRYRQELAEAETPDVNKSEPGFEPSSADCHVSAGSFLTFKI